MKTIRTLIMAVCIPLAACASYPKGAARFAAEAQTPRLSLDAPVVVDFKRHVAPVQGYKSAPVYPAAEWHMLDVLPPPIMVEEPTRRCAAQRGNSLYEGPFDGHNNFFYRYLNAHREGVRGTVDWGVDGVLSDWPHYFNVMRFHLPYAPRTTETQFFRAYERHDLCLSGKPNAMDGARAFCDAELADDIDRTCSIIYNTGYSRFDCGIRATYVKFVVAGLGGALDKSSEASHPFDNVTAACTTYRGWTAPVDQVVKLRTGPGDAANMVLARLSADRAANSLRISLTPPAGDSRSWPLALSPDTAVCNHFSTQSSQYGVVDCASSTVTLRDFGLTVSDFLMVRPQPVDLNGDGHDELLLFAPAGMKARSGSKTGKTQVAIVVLPLAFTGDRVVAGQPYMLASFNHNPQVDPGEARDARERLLSLLSERTHRGSFLIDDVHARTAGSQVLRPEQVAMASVVPTQGDQALDLRTIGFRMSDTCGDADSSCFTGMVLTRTVIFKDGRIDPFGDTSGKKSRANVEIYKRMFYPAGEVHVSTGGDALAFYFARSGLRSDEGWLPQYMERVTLGPVRVGDVYALDLHTDADGWYSQDYAGADSALQDTCTHTAKSVLQLDWFGCRPQARNQESGIARHSDYRLWSKLLYPAVPAPGKALRYAPFLTNCSVIDESRSQCTRGSKETIRLAVIDEDKPSRIVSAKGVTTILPVFDNPPDQVTLVDIDNTQWARVAAVEDPKQTHHDKKARSCVPHERSWETACEWFELPAYTGRFGPDGEPALLFVKKEPDDAAEKVEDIDRNVVTRTVKSVSLLAVYQVDGTWTAAEYSCPAAMPPLQRPAGLSRFWLVAANAMVVPGSGKQDDLMFPQTLSSGDGKARTWGWVKISLSAPGKTDGGDTVVLSCRPAEGKSHWIVTANARVVPGDGKHHDLGFHVESSGAAN